MNKAITTLLLTLSLLTPALSSAQCPEEEECYEPDEDAQYLVEYRYRTTEGHRQDRCRLYLSLCTDGTTDRYTCEGLLRQCRP